MGDYSELKDAIREVIKSNGNEEITGPLLQSSLLSIINSIGQYRTFAGVATPPTNPSTIDQKVFYLAVEAGTYANFGGVALPKGLSLLYADNDGWNHKIVVDEATLKGKDGIDGRDGTFAASYDPTTKTLSFISTLTDFNNEDF